MKRRERRGFPLHPGRRDEAAIIMTELEKAHAEYMKALTDFRDEAIKIIETYQSNADELLSQLSHLSTVYEHENTTER